MLPCLSAGTQFGEELKLFQGVYREGTAKLRSLALERNLPGFAGHASITYALAEAADSCEIRFVAPVAQLDRASAF